MEIEFADQQGLERAVTDPRFDAGLGPILIKAFRDKIEFLKSCHSEQDIRAMKSLHYEKLKGARRHQHSIRLKRDAKRLIFQIIERDGQKVIRIVEVADYH
jgi:proteic killer suppression protein